MVSTIEELDEMRARAMCAEYHLNHFEQVATENYIDKRWENYLPFARSIREADERAGLVTLHEVMSDHTRSTIRDNGGSQALAYALAAWIDILRTSPFAKKDDAK